MYLPSIQKTPASSVSSQLCTYHQYRRHQHHCDDTHDAGVFCIDSKYITVMIQMMLVSSVLMVSTQKAPASSVSSQLCTYHQYRKHQHPLCHHSYVLTINTEDTSILCVITVTYLPSIQKTPASSVVSSVLMVST
jgi:hypothetical protein